MTAERGPHAAPICQPLPHHTTPAGHPPVPAAVSCAKRASADAPRAPLLTRAWKKACSASSAEPAGQRRVGGAGCAAGRAGQHATHSKARSDTSQKLPHTKARSSRGKRSPFPTLQQWRLDKPNGLGQHLHGRPTGGRPNASVLAAHKCLDLAGLSCTNFAEPGCLACWPMPGGPSPATLPPEAPTHLVHHCGGRGGLLPQRRGGKVEGEGGDQQVPLVHQGGGLLQGCSRGGGRGHGLGGGAGKSVARLEGSMMAGMRTGRLQAGRASRSRGCGPGQAGRAAPDWSTAGSTLLPSLDTMACRLTHRWGVLCSASPGRFTRHQW